MNRTYMMNMALQGRGRFDSALYVPAGFKVKNNFETHFPILPIIKNELEEGDSVKLIVVRADNADAAYNTELLKNELKNMGIDIDPDILVEREVKKEKDYSQMILSILKMIPETGTLSVDITYGTKPESFMIYYAAMIAEISKTDIEFEGIYYGQIIRENFKTAGALLHRLDMMKSLLDMTISLKSLGYSDIEILINKLMAEE